MKRLDFLSPGFRIFLGLVLIFWLIIILVRGLVFTLMDAADERAARLERSAMIQTVDWRPNIRHCHDPAETRSLWDCIRGKMRRDDI